MTRSKMLPQLLAALLTLAGASATHSAQGNDRLAEFERLAAAGDDATLLRLLEDTVKDPGWVPEARERLLFDFTQQLRELPPNAVGPRVLTFLSEYTPEVMVPHPDAPRALVPLYNIRSAASGVRHAWRRQEATYNGSLQLARGDIDGFVKAYGANADHPARQGLLEALRGAPQAQLEAVAAAALAAPARTPGMSLLAGEAAVLARDWKTIGQVLQSGESVGLAPLLRRCARTLDGKQLERLLDTAIETADPAVAAIAIAEFTSSLVGRPAVEERLFALLGDPELGAAAALALATPGGPARIERLAELAKSDSLAARRARMALDLVAEDALTQERIK